MNNTRSRLQFQSNKLKSCQALYPFGLSLSPEKRFFFLTIALAHLAFKSNKKTTGILLYQLEYLEENNRIRILTI